MVIAGVASRPASVTLATGGGVDSPSSKTEEVSLDFVYDMERALLTVRKPDVFVAEDFDMTLSFTREG